MRKKIQKLNIDNILDINNEICYYCGKKLTDKNKSSWNTFDIINNESIKVHQCLICCEVHRRMLINAKKDRNNILLTKTYQQCLKEIKLENIAENILKQMEDIQLKTKN